MLHEAQRAARIVKDLLDPITYQPVQTMGRRINIIKSTKDVTKLFPYEYLEATVRNKGSRTAKKSAVGFYLSATRKRTGDAARLGRVNAKKLALEAAARGAPTSTSGSGPPASFLRPR